MEYFERRLPIYILIDCSQSMAGEPIKAVFDHLWQLCSDLKTDPQALETVWLSVIAFSSGAELVTRLTGVMEFNPPALPVGPGRCLGAALDLLGDRIAHEVRPAASGRKGDWSPLVLLLTDGPPTDAWREALVRYKAKTARQVASFYAIGCGAGVDVSMLLEITPTAFRAAELTAGQTKSLWRWVSHSDALESGRDVPSPDDERTSPLPPPPRGINGVL